MTARSHFRDLGHKLVAIGTLVCIREICTQGPARAVPDFRAPTSCPRQHSSRLFKDPNSMAAICPACGTENRPAAKFCMQCITALSPADAQPKQPFGDERTAVYIKPTQLLSDIEGEGRTGRAGAAHALPEGTEIEGFQIVRQIGEGGFGIVYLAWDATLERHVAIKEYMPASLAVRSAVSLGVSIRSEQHCETFDAG